MRRHCAIRGSVKPVEGPRVIQLIGEKRWYIYAAPFYNNFMARETTDSKALRKLPLAHQEEASIAALLLLQKKNWSY